MQPTEVSKGDADPPPEGAWDFPEGNTDAASAQMGEPKAYWTQALNSLLKCLTCAWCAGCCLLPSALLIRWLAAVIHNCGIHPWHLRFGHASKFELFFGVAHWIGVRSLVSWAPKMTPQYKSAHFFAQSSPKGMGPRCALTIDDAVWSESKFENLLAVLSAHAVSATFFVIANNASILTDWGGRLLRKAVAAGHEIGNHGLTNDAMNHMDRHEFAAAIDAWEERIRFVLPQWPVHPQDWKWFRPPLARMSTAMVEVLEERGYEVAGGDVYTSDTEVDNAEYHSHLIKEQTCDGSVIILHVYPAQLLPILSECLPALHARGMKFATLTELFSKEQGSFGACGIGLLLMVMVMLSICICWAFFSVCSLQALTCPVACCLALACTAWRKIPLDRAPGEEEASALDRASGEEEATSVSSGPATIGRTSL